MEDCQIIETDVLVVGAGGAGCQAAMAAADAGARVVLIEKGRLGVTGNTFDPFTWGKGIISAAKGYNPTDDPEVHYREAMGVARDMAVPALVKAVAYDAPGRFHELLDMGVPFIPSQVGSCFGDTMRGTKGIMLDMYRHPDKVVAACEAFVPLSIDMGARSPVTPFMFMPLHKGAEGFMSNEQFEKFYWPSLRSVLLGLIDEGLVPLLFVEGGYTKRLDIIRDSGLPKGRTMWLFDQTDMKAAKEKMGDWACIGGNVPASLFATGTPADMENYCEQLIKDCAPGGGFFLAPGANIDHAKPDNIRAFLNSTKNDGVY